MPTIVHTIHANTCFVLFFSTKKYEKKFKMIVLASVFGSAYGVDAWQPETTDKIKLVKKIIHMYTLSKIAADTKECMPWVEKTLSGSRTEIQEVTQKMEILTLSKNEDAKSIDIIKTHLKEMDLEYDFKNLPVRKENQSTCLPILLVKTQNESPTVGVIFLPHMLEWSVNAAKTAIATEYTQSLKPSLFAPSLLTDDNSEKASILQKRLRNEGDNGVSINALSTKRQKRTTPSPPLSSVLMTWTPLGGFFLWHPMNRPHPWPVLCPHKGPSKTPPWLAHEDCPG